jgi:glycolate oxidase FAD binding subunit
MDTDLSQAIAERVRVAWRESSPLRLVAGGSKSWLGRTVAGETLDLGGHRGIVNYEPTELVLTARAGTPLAEIEATLAEHGQCLAFEPPHFGGAASLGGTIACNLSGPARPYAGAARDFVLGARIVNGRGEILRFGGEVMKNVAGYDVARLMAGAQGSLGVLLEISLKVLPRPEAETTLAFDLSGTQAIAAFNVWAGRPLPLSAACHIGERASLRLAGSEAAVQAARLKLGGEVQDNAASFWSDLRELRHAFFAQPGTLWRLSLSPASRVDASLGSQVIDWGGAQRWVFSERPLWDFAVAAGGHATCWRGGDRDKVFQPLNPGLLALQRRLKSAFDPNNILNPGRLYPEL